MIKKKYRSRITALIMTAILAAEVMPAYAVDDKTEESDKAKLPVISITGVTDGAYYQTEQTAKVIIKEKTENFDENRVQITITKNETDIIQSGSMIGACTTIETGEQGESIYEFPITLTGDATYHISADYIPKEGGNIYADSGSFVIDGTAPDGHIFADGLSWDKNIAFTNKRILFEYEMHDSKAGLNSNATKWYKSSSTTVMSTTELDNLPEDSWTSPEPVISDDEHCVVYMRIFDMAGNIGYASTSGIIYDSVPPKIEITAPIPINSEHGYENDLNVKVSVTDPEKNGVCSGIINVKYKLYINDDIMQQGQLYSFNKLNPKETDLVKSYIEDQNLIVKADVLNSDNKVVLVVTAEDNAGNTSTNEMQLFTFTNLNTNVPKITDTKAEVYTDRVTLSWDKISTAEGYNIYVDGKKKNDNLITENTYTIKGLKKNTSYKVNVTSVTDGTESEKTTDISLTTGSILLGDLSGDGKISIIDAMRIFHYVSGRNKNIELSKADINGDGKVNIIDAMKIFHYVSGRNKEY